MQAAGTIDNTDIIKAISTIVVIVMCVSWLYATIALCHSISKRTGHGKWWTAGLIFVSWLFFPVTAFHYEK